MKGAGMTGVRVLLTRPAQAAARSAARLRRQGIAVLSVPLSRIVPTQEPCPAGPFDAVAVTSAAALPALSNAGLPADIPVFAVGATTSAAAHKAGFTHVVTGPGEARGLAATISRAWPAGSRVLMVLARDHKPHLPDGLAAAGLRATVWLAYGAQPATRLPPRLVRALSDGSLTHALHYSRRSAAILRALARDAGCERDLMRLRHLCLSADVAQALDGLDVTVADSPTEDGLLACMRRAGTTGAAPQRI
jgi:uroporphyrinogen-III synthase